MKNKKVFILYQYNDFNNDFLQVMEYYSIKELKEKNKDILKLKDGTNLQKYICNSIDNIKEKINNRYIIIREVIQWKLKTF